MSTPSAPVAMARDLWCVPTGASNAYLWRGPDGVVVVDPGLPGDDATVLDALATVGCSPTEVGLIVLTHWHTDHSGAAPALAGVTGAEIAAGAPDAAVLRGEADARPPDLVDAERPMWESIAAALPQNMGPPRCAVTRDLADGDRLDGAGHAVVHLLAGHTDGSVAVHLPALGAVLTGDVAMRGFDGEVAFGLFHVDRDRTRAAVRRLAALEPEVAGFGHGAPALENAAGALAVAARD